MPALKRIRVYHALLAIGTVLAYLIGDWEPVHSYIGYGVAAIVMIRLGMAATGLSQLGLFRFYPQFGTLKLRGLLTHPAVSRSLLFGIAVSLIGTIGTGLALDKGAVLGLSPAIGIREITRVDHAEPIRDEEGDDSILGESHELLANLLIVLVALHVTYLIIFKRPLARYMLFLDRSPQ